MSWAVPESRPIIGPVWNLLSVLPSGSQTGWIFQQENIISSFRIIAVPNLITVRMAVPAAAAQLFQR